MGETIDKLIGQVSSYEILNNVIPGAVYASLVEKLTSFCVFTGQFWVDLVISYFLGLIIGRLGSLIIAEFAQRKHGSQFAVYEDYLKAEKNDTRIRDLTAISNMYRSFASLALCVLLTFGFSFLWEAVSGISWIKIVFVIAGCLLVAYIFQKSYYKQKMYVVKRVKEANNICEHDYSEK